jgi:hypothetical protein
MFKSMDFRAGLGPNQRLRDRVLVAVFVVLWCALMAFPVVQLARGIQ